MRSRLTPRRWPGRCRRAARLGLPRPSRLAQLRLLFVLRQSGPVSIGQLGRHPWRHRCATASEFVDRVERRGLATRIHREDDRPRWSIVSSATTGARLLAEIEGARQDARCQQVLKLLTADELASSITSFRIMGRAFVGLIPTIDLDTRRDSGESRNATHDPARDAGGAPA